MKTIIAEIRAFTLIETLVAVSLLVVAIVAPMSLVAQSLASAYYARDQIAAYNLAQEGIEAVRAVRDGNILSNAVSGGGATNDLLENIPINQNFIIDARLSDGDEALRSCGLTPCEYLKVDGDVELYGHDPTWTTVTRFQRYGYASYVGPAGVNGGQDEIRVTVTVKWDTSSGRQRVFQMYSNMYRWVCDGVANESNPGSC